MINNMMSIAMIKARLNSNVPPIDMVMPTSKPERIVDGVIERVWSQCKGPSKLCAWVVRREGFYFDGPGSEWDHRLITYAACRDVLVYQTQKSEREIINDITRMH